MKFGDCYNKKINIRLSDFQYTWLSDLSDKLNVPLSECIRIIINTKIGECKNEDKQTYFNNKL